MSSGDKELRKVGLKVTLPRIKVLQVLESADPHHLTAEDVYRALVDSGEEVGLATVYRVLTQFESAGLVERHNFDSGQAIFELARGGHHDHIVCVDCGHVLEFTDSIIEAQQDKIATRMGFELEDHSLYLYGRCKKKKCPNRDEP
jgi:Fur family ferric uptake transcriptional regulator